MMKRQHIIKLLNVLIEDGILTVEKLEEYGKRGIINPEEEAYGVNKIMKNEGEKDE